MLVFDGGYALVNKVGTCGRYPLCLAVSKKYLAVCNSGSGSIVLFYIDNKVGIGGLAAFVYLGTKDMPLAVPNCVIFHDNHMFVSDEKNSRIIAYSIHRKGSIKGCI